MKTKYRGQSRLIVEEFTVEQLKEYLVSVVKFSTDMKQLIRMAETATGSKLYLDKDFTIRMETYDKGEV